MHIFVLGAEQDCELMTIGELPLRKQFFYIALFTERMTKCLTTRVKSCIKAINWIKYKIIIKYCMHKNPHYVKRLLKSKGL